VQADNAYAETCYQVYVDERKQQCEASLELSGRFDQWMVTLPGGALALSLGFLEKIAPNPAAPSVYLVGCAWVTLISSLLFALTSLFTAVYGCNRQITIIDDAEKCRQAGAPSLDAPNRWRTATHVLNILSLVTFIAGTVFLCGFAFSNLKR